MMLAIVQTSFLKHLLFSILYKSIVCLKMLIAYCAYLSIQCYLEICVLLENCCGKFVKPEYNLSLVKI
jgi:hypothetical protein